ncbi:SEC10/PgrA surface exclusion domain-containing protein [Limosilactobacillus reuteri]|uniref:SEC10/PgrA surface exclusion domain-containing protein n=1 Tax=Limosilactobacillus reuteri TaxID=1598 RepID=A0A7X2FZE5_LIMRT|nr:SEC10/PgrA surface exclusion domain-containing protein [Limosilactobacillus reuteri]MRG88628.1 SEC10/PgrA surface exclusion domain-containing protein [Limosilactobacillus reuteri]
MSMKKGSHKILKSVALAGALTATGAVATTAHADTTKASAPVQGVASTDQQLTNLKSRQTANESAVASSNATTMSAATTSANSQIADLNNQIKERQASDAVTQQNKIDQVNKDAQTATNTENSAYSSAFTKQVAANDAKLKAAQAKVVTEQQEKQETTQENTDFQKQTDNLATEHNSKLSKINTDYQSQTDPISQKLTEAKKADQDHYNQKVANATKQVDDRIDDANNTINQAQKMVNDDQSDVNNKQNADKTAQSDVQNKQSTLNNDQNTLKQVQQEFDDLKETTNHIIVPQDYIDVWKEYVKIKKPNDQELTVAKFPELHSKNIKACTEAKRLNKAAGFHASSSDENTPITLTPEGTLSREDTVKATQYAVQLINPVRKAIGTTQYRITNASIDIAMQVGQVNRADNDWGHDMNAHQKAKDKWGLDTVGESVYATSGKTPYKTLADLKHGVYDAVIDLLFEGNTDDGKSDNGHTTDLLNVRCADPDSALEGTDFLGVSYENNQNITWSTAIRFVSIVDGKSDRMQNLRKKGYRYKAGTLADKSAQGSNYDQIAVPNPNETAKKLQDQISQLQAKVDDDIQNLNTSKGKANVTTNALKAAKDKLANDEKALTKAHDRLNNLKNNHDKMIHDIAGDPTPSQDVKNLQAQLNQIKSAYDNTVKSENERYETKLNDLKKNHEAKLAEIAAQPTSLAELQSQLQAKLDTLKAKHDAKLKQITDDANAKIAAIKSQKVNDPEIDKLNAQIDQIKSDLAKKQQELDSQYEALKTKNQAEYNALANKLNSSTKAVVNGSAQQVFTSRSGKVAYVIPGHQSIATRGAVKTVSEQNNSDSLSKEFQSQNNNRLPQTGNQSSLAMVLLGAAAAMFGVGLAGKKKEY